MKAARFFFIKALRTQLSKFKSSKIALSSVHSLTIALGKSFTALFFNNCSAKISLSQSASQSSSASRAVNCPTKLSCSINGNIYKPEESVTGLSASPVVFPHLCGAQVSRTCQATGEFNGEFNGSVPLFPSCNQHGL